MYCDDVLTNAIAAKNRQLEEENARLKALNREMVVALKDIRKIVYKARHYEIDHDDRAKLINITGYILAKAEEVGE